MNRIIVRSTLLAAAVTFALPGLAQARGGFGGWGHGPGGRFGGPGEPGAFGGKRFEELASKLNLDAKTRGQVQSIFVQSRAEAKALRDQLRKAREAMHNAMMEEPPKESTVMARAAELHDLQGKLQRLRLKTLLHVSALLTPAQRAQLRELHKGQFEAIKQACQADMTKLCPGAGPGRDMMRCMRQNKDKVSQGCRDAVMKLRGGDRHGGPR